MPREEIWLRDARFPGASLGEVTDAASWIVEGIQLLWALGCFGLCVSCASMVICLKLENVLLLGPEMNYVVSP